MRAFGRAQKCRRSRVVVGKSMDLTRTKDVILSSCCRPSQPRHESIARAMLIRAGDARFQGLEHESTPATRQRRSLTCRTLLTWGLAQCHMGSVKRPPLSTKRNSATKDHRTTRRPGPRGASFPGLSNIILLLKLWGSSSLHDRKELKC
jgi:hypothetical protein